MYEENNLLLYGILILACLVGAWVTAFIIQKFLKRTYERSQSTSVPMDPTVYKFIHNAIAMVCFILATIIIFTTIPTLRSFGLSLFASAGLMALVVGFAAQAALANIVAGLFVVLFRPFRVGDLITVGTNQGFVEDITLRHTVIRNFNNVRIVIPNSAISSDTILNSTIDDPKLCSHLEIGISYHSDLERAIEILREESMKHPNLIDNRTEEDIAEGVPQVIIRVMAWQDSSILLRAYLWSEEPIAGFVMRTDLLRTLKHRFDEEGIEIPFPHRTVYHRQEKPMDFRQTKSEERGHRD